MLHGTFTRLLAKLKVGPIQPIPSVPILLVHILNPCRLTQHAMSTQTHRILNVLPCSAGRVLWSPVWRHMIVSISNTTLFLVYGALKCLRVPLYTLRFETYMDHAPYPQQILGSIMLQDWLTSQTPRISLDPIEHACSVISIVHAQRGEMSSQLNIVLKWPFTFLVNYLTEIHSCSGL